ncbi:MAG: nuclear transport factor 2 family protein [Vicinamibacterales bacterium]
MSMNIDTSGVHHLALRVTDLRRSRAFYAQTLGFPVVLEGPGIFLFLAGHTAVAIRGPETGTAVDDVFSPFRVGLDHVALACADERELARVAGALAAAQVENTGVRLDPALNRQYVAFKDPDRIAWEFYMAPDLAREAALSYVEGLRSGDVDHIRFAKDVRFESPLVEALRGADAVREFLRGVLPVILDVQVDHAISDGEKVAVRFQLHTTKGIIPAFDWFRVVNGEIVEARPFYDPRPLVATDAAESARSGA